VSGAYIPVLLSNYSACKLVSLPSAALLSPDPCCVVPTHPWTAAAGILQLGLYPSWCT
jgi:hypothetical protein